MCTPFRFLTIRAIQVIYGIEDILLADEYGEKTIYFA